MSDEGRRIVAGGHASLTDEGATVRLWEDRNAGRFRNTPGIYAALVLALLTMVVWDLLAQVGSLLIMLYLAVLLACGIAGPVRWLERLGINRAVSIMLVFAVFGAAIVAAGWYAFPPLLGQAEKVIDELPDHVTRFEQLEDRWSGLQEEYPILSQLDERLVSSSGQAGAYVTRVILAMPAAIAQGMFAVTSILTFSFLFLMSWERIKATILMLIHPRQRTVTDQVLGEIGERLGAYLRAKVIVMTIVGIWVYVTLMLLGSPYALLAAIIAALMEAIPRIGPWIGRFVIVLAALPLGWQAVVISVVSHVVIENIKGYGLGPLIEGQQVDIHPLTAFIAVIAGGLLLGWVGALVAVPTAAVFQVLVEDVVIPWRRRQLRAAEAEWARQHPSG